MQSDFSLVSSELDTEQKKAIIQAIDNYNSGNYRSAVQLLMPIVEKTYDVTVYTCIGNCYLKMGDFLNSRKYFKKAIERPTLNAFPFISFGNLYYEEGDINKAILHWTVASTLVGDDPNLLLNLANAYSQKALRIQSLIYYEKYIKRFSNSAGETYKKICSEISKLKATSAKLNGIGSKHHINKAINRAIDSYSSSVANYPLQPQVNTLLGNLFFLIKDYKAAVECLLNAYVTSGFNVSSISYLPLAYENLNMHSHAYCFYYILLSGRGKKSFRANELKSKLLKNSLIVFRDDEASGGHFEKAKEYEADNNYQLAYVEYTNALILAKADKSKIEASRSKMLDFINPEVRIVSNLQVQLNSCFNEENYSKAIEICDKILLLLPINSSADAPIRRKRKECQDLLNLSKKS